jgi:hypothetical protein
MRDGCIDPRFLDLGTSWKTMVYNIQNYWVFGLCPSFGILKTREHNFSETWSLSILRWEGGGITRTLLGPLDKANISH